MENRQMDLCPKNPASFGWMALDGQAAVPLVGACNMLEVLPPGASASASVSVSAADADADADAASASAAAATAAATATAAAAISSASVSSWASASSAGTVTEVSDLDITRNLTRVLLAAADLQSKTIGVVANRGDVRLTAVPDNQILIDTALGLAHAAQGVYAVCDEWTLKP